MPPVENEPDGQKALIAKLFGEYQSKLLLLFSRAFSSDPDERQDMVQETWLELIRNKVDFLELREPWAYILTCARNVATRHRKGRSRDREHVIFDSDLAEDVTEDTTQDRTEDPTVVQRDVPPSAEALTEYLEDAKKKLHPRIRAVLELDLQGWSNQEVADRCGLTLHQVERDLTEARQLLKSILSDANQGRRRDK